MTHEQLQSLLFGAFTAIGKDSDGEYKIQLYPDEDCDQPVVVYIRLDETKIRVYAICPKFLKISNQDIVKQLLLANQWNAEKTGPKAFAIKSDGFWNIMCEEYLFFNEEEYTLSDEYIINFIKRVTAFSWSFYVSMNAGEIR